MVDKKKRRLFKSTAKTIPMKRKQASHPKQDRSKKSKLRDLHGSPKEDVAIRRSSRIKQMDFEEKQELFSSDPNPSCSGSSRSVASYDKILSGIRKSDHRTRYVGLNPAHNSVVILSDDGEEEMEQLESKQNVADILDSKSKAESALAAFGLNKSHSTSHVGFERQLDGSLYDESVTSGPSSPCGKNAHRCSECERLFSRMKKKAPLKIKKRSNDPACLSCDEWVLKKIWRPQRKRQVRGRLWVHLRWIRHRATERADAAGENTSWSLCSRPHVFLQRLLKPSDAELGSSDWNLRHCRKESSMHRSLSESKVNQRRRRAKPALQLSSTDRKMKRKPSEKDSTFLDKTVIRSSMEDKLAAKHDAYRQGVQQQGNVVKKTPVSEASSFLVNQTSCSDLEGTGRVEAFHAPYYDGPMGTLKQRQGLVHTDPGDKLHEDHASFTTKNCQSRMDNVLTEDLDGFWTPVDHSNVESKTSRKNQPSKSRGVQMDSFRSKLATLETNCNRIIKESHR